MADAFAAKRKRSGRVALTTMVALSSGAMLASCGDGDSVPAAKAAQDVPSKPADALEVQVFENVFECAKVTGKTRQQCAADREQALAAAEKESPRFASLEDCEAEFGAGQCMQPGEDTERRRHFSPFLVAWISTKDGAGKNAPLFKGKGGGMQTANGMKLGYAGAPGKYYASSRGFEKPKTVPKVKPASKLASRGGFGSRNGSWNLKDRNGGANSSSSRSGVRSKGG